MSIHPIFGHDSARNDLELAASGDRLPQAMLITGPSGVGKQRLALWLAQRMLCIADSGQPCGKCRGCTQVLTLSHPDLHWFVPVLRAKAGEPDKQMAEVSDALAAALDERRTGLWGDPGGMAVHGIASARLIQRTAALTAVERGGWRIFIIGEAERLVPQESSPEAANALLKLLEEPPPRSLWLLTATQPGSVLPTIRSRCTPVRLGRVNESAIRAFFATAKPGPLADSVIARADGSIGNALVAMTSGDAAPRLEQAASHFLRSAREGQAQAAIRALQQTPWQARGDFTDLLDAVARQMATTARTLVARDAARGERMLAGVERVLQTRERAQGNVNPQLLLAVLADELAAAGAV